MAEERFEVGARVRKHFHGGAPNGRLGTVVQANTGPSEVAIRWDDYNNYLSPNDYHSVPRGTFERVETPKVVANPHPQEPQPYSAPVDWPKGRSEDKNPVLMHRGHHHIPVTPEQLLLADRMKAANRCPAGHVPEYMGLNTIECSRCKAEAKKAKVDPLDRVKSEWLVREVGALGFDDPKGPGYHEPKWWCHKPSVKGSKEETIDAWFATEEAAWAWLKANR